MPGLKSAVDLAQRSFDRQKQLLAEKVISASEFEQAENNLRSAQANYNAALQNVKRGEASIQGAQANLSKADKDLGRTAVVAPRDGVISLMNVKRGRACSRCRYDGGYRNDAHCRYERDRSAGGRE